MFKALGHIARLYRIGRVLAKNDALFLFEQWGFIPTITKILKNTSWHKQKDRPGKRLAKALQELGPAFIKLGQALSTRSDLLGDDVAEDLALLRDELPAFSGKKSVEIIESELGKKVSELFEEFDEEPIAAASIAQVHFATDKAGNKLAVKVLRPDVEKKFERDVQLMFWVAKQLEKRLPKMQRLKLREVVQVFADAVRVEMDLRLEAAAATELREHLRNDKTIHIPKIDWERTSRRVLTMERVAGIKIDNLEALKKAKHKPEDIIEKLAMLLFKTAFKEGFFHADLHPGNIFVDKKGNLILVDFGIMGRLDEKSRFFVAGMMQAFVKKDFNKVSDLHFEFGIVPESQSREDFALACRSIAEPILGRPQNEVSIAKLLAQLFKVAEDYKMNLQPQFLMLQKAMMLVEGVGRKIDPNMNMWKLAEPVIEEWARANMGPEAKLKMAGKKFKDMRKIFKQYIKNSEHIFTPDGLRLHPDTIEALKTGNVKK
jgi:ubiquinone biosynthesis protein